MQKISRIYLAGCGHRTCWYDGIVIPTTDPGSGEPTDTIIQLENGGGKTTLLGLIFSCFETEQNRFLKHLQSKQARFSQYFDQNGVPGFIVVEWLMPPRTAGAPPYRLVVGQSVSVRNTTEPAEVDRLFFAFKEQADLTLESVPAPNLASPPAANLAEFSRWIHDLQRKHPDVFSTRNQDEWKRHLKTERLIDLDMLQMQVNFSAQEGGFDAFVNFKTESEFLKKFFSLTLDQAKAEEARRLVVQVCEKHARKPEFQRRRDELTKFRGTLNLFAETARVYLDSLASQGTLVLQGAQLSFALQARAAGYLQEHEQEVQVEKLQRDLAVAANTEANALARRVATATFAWHQKRVLRAKSRKDAADKAVKELEDKSLFIRAARLQRDIQASVRQIADLEALAEAHREELKPAREHVETQGALLRRALFQEESRIQGVLEDLKKRASERDGEKRKQLDAQDTAERQEAGLVREEAELHAAEKRRGARVLVLATEGILLTGDEHAGDAVDRWRGIAKQYLTERDGHRAERTTVRRQASERRAAAGKERKRAHELEGEVKRLQAFRSDGAHELERLSQMPALLEAAESDTVDPLSPLLPTSLSNVLASCSKQIAAIDVRLAELGLTKQAIETSKVAGYSADVAQVVQVLRNAGVRSARPFNEYVAEAIPDATRARALVLSDPARFLGVCVARGEFEKAAGVQWTGHLPRKPVMVSVTALDPTSLAGERTVVPAENDAAYNVSAAAVLATEIAGKVAADTQQRKALESRLLATVKAIRDVETFSKLYGDGKLAKAAADETSTAEDAAATTARAEALEADAVDFEARGDDLETKATVADGKFNESNSRVKRLEEFQAEYEVGRAQRLHRIGEMPALVTAAQESKAAARDALEKIQAAHDAAVEKRASETVLHAGLGLERAELKYYDKEYDAASALHHNPRPLDELRRLYKDAEDNYLTDERERLGSLSVKIQGEINRKNEKTSEFNRDYLTVTVEQFRPYLGVNHEEALADAGAQLKEARATAAQDTAAHLLATKEAKSSTERDKALIDAIDAELEALDVDDLEARRVALGQDLEAAQNRMRLAKDEADKAKGRGDTKKMAASLDLTADKLVRDALGFGDKADASLALADILATTGVVIDPDTIEQPVLAVNAADQVSSLLRQYGDKGKTAKKHYETARRSFEALKAAASAKPFLDADADVAQQMQENGFDETCRDAERLLTHLDDRIRTTEDTLANMQADFDACIEEVSEVVRNAILTLNKACGPDKCVPAGAQYIGGKQVLKMRANFSGINAEARRAVMRNYLDYLADTKLIAPRGTDLIADAVSRVHGRPLGLQVLKMSIEETEQYVPVEKISNSGGEGVVMAMFLYLVITQLRAENYADVQKSAGGPLILDNPFAKATSAAMWHAQRLLAKEMNVQLIFATAIQDYNALGEFQRFVRMRKLQNLKTKRWHLEGANFTLKEAVAESLA